MRWSWCTAFALLAVVLVGCSGTSRRESVYTLNGKQLAMKGPQTLQTPKGVSVQVEARLLTATLEGEEEITINGRRFRAYGDKVEVNGKAYPVGQGETLEVTEDAVVIRGAGVSGPAEGGG